MTFLPPFEPRLELPSSPPPFQDLELEMMTDMYARLTSSCQKKCVPPKYREPELQKGESVCLDRKDRDGGRRVIKKAFVEKVGKNISYTILFLKTLMIGIVDLEGLVEKSFLVSYDFIMLMILKMGMAELNCPASFA